ncbi:ornithine cyclodeaminase family protein [Metallosphaera cuprina]|uniref:Ornithine cyclodeaminase n=1 Tax=Metallosphaera cuprina (strain Ar-4) TaxID=1006006 RepID=F4G044_METCR|nr:ornithine cyclodeaminase family protein [Metallosphaera cuprina]AEB94543.1 ornithine cyclodeaminase [Metallosphaera cuprina Ar-4]
MRVLTDQELVQALTPEKAVSAMREAFSLLFRGEVHSPQRTVMTFGEDWWGVMPCRTKYLFTVKVVAVIPGNKSRGLPAVNGSVLAMSPDTAEPIAILPGATLTAIRTAATSVLSTELAFGRKVDVLGVIGAGQEAEFHIRIARGYLSTSRILVSARRSHLELSKRLEVEAVDLDSLLKESDVIFATTSSSSPVVKGSLLKEGFHVVSIGAHTPEARELDDETGKRARTFIVDSLQAVSSESGDYIQMSESGVLKARVLELGEVVERDLKVERPSIFKSVGVSVQDNLASYYAIKNAI